MTADRWARVEDLFDRAADLPRADRAAFLDAACRDADGTPDRALREEADRMLALDTGADGFFHDLTGGGLGVPEDPLAGVPERVGPWRLVCEVGKGGMGTVYLAERDDGTFAQRAAVKLAKRSGDETAALFAHEARLLQRLPTPAVAHLLDAGESADGRAYLALERIEGRSVSAVARDQTAWERLLLLWRVCRAVGGLHQQEVVHGDLKPDHLVLRPDGTVVVLDLGLARDLRDPAAPASGRRLGLTPEFAAPEQILGEPVGTAADVYALGLVIREVLEGCRTHVPWAVGGETDAEIDLSEAAPGASGALIGRYVGEVLRTALQTDPARRYPTAGALARALDDVLDAVAEAPRLA